MSDRHKQARIYVRVPQAQRAEFAALATECGVSITDLASTALQSFVASLRTAKLREVKAESRKARVLHPCVDAMCSKPLNHLGPCNFGRPENG